MSDWLNGFDSMVVSTGEDTGFPAEISDKDGLLDAGGSG
jgi:hypothetical protein